MHAAGKGCYNVYEDICEFKDYDFDTFIAPFPGIKATPEVYKKRMEQREMLKEYKEQMGIACGPHIGCKVL